MLPPARPLPPAPAPADLQLERPAIRVVVNAHLGARVVSLVDRRSGREWLARGAMPDAVTLAAWSDDEAEYGGAEAFGWDECLPTVGRSADPLHADAAPLRDHGNVWGRGAATSVDQGTLVTEWPADRWGLGFRRRLRLDSSAVIADYALYNPNKHAVPFLWSAHPLLQLEPGTRIHLPRVDRLAVYGERGLGLPGRHVGWPRTSTADGHGLQLDVVQPASAGFSLKAFARVLEGRAGVLTPDGSWLGVAWDPAFAPHLGLWLNYGAWPADHPLHHLALEPTTAAHDRLTEAIAARQVTSVGPGRTVRWWMRVEMGISPPGLAAFLRG